VLSPLVAVDVSRRPHNHYVLAFTAVLAIIGTAASLFQHTAPVQRLARHGGDWIAAVVPRFLALVAFVAGALLLFSGATPALGHRLQWLGGWLPLPLIELSHFFDNLVGITLLILARGLERRLDAAYHLTIGMLVLSILLTLLRALDVELAVVLTLILFAFIPNRKYFYRRTSLIEERFTLRWVMAILVVVGASIALGWVSYADMHLSTEEFFHFTRRAEAARFLRATAGGCAVLLVFAILRLLRPARPIIPRPTPKDFDDARALVAQAPEAAAHLAFLGDKFLLFNEQRTGFIMYSVYSRSWVALGDPVAPAREVRGLVARFHEMADNNNSWPVFYKVSSTFLHLYLDYGMSVVKLGEEARVALTDFSLDGPTRRNLRRVWRKVVDAGCTFEILPVEKIPDVLEELREISNAWLTDKNVREKGFSLGLFDDAYVRQYPVAVVRQQGRIIAFANIWCSGYREELEVDLMRYLPDAPPGIMRYLLVEMMLWGRTQGYRWFNLGMAPLSGLTRHKGAPVWNQLATAVRGAGERFYNFEGLREFKQWFYPEWEPQFLASPGGTARPIILANIASLIAGGFDGILKK